MLWLDIIWIGIAAFGLGLTWWQMHVAYWDVQRCKITEKNGRLLRDLVWHFKQQRLSTSVQLVFLVIGIFRYFHEPEDNERVIATTVAIFYASTILSVKAVRQSRLRDVHAAEYIVDRAPGGSLEGRSDEKTEENI